MSLEIRNLDLLRGSRLLQSSLSFSVEFGEAMWVRGPNGVGKSTLLETICGLRDMHGEVLWNGTKDKDALHNDLAYIGHKNGNASALTLAQALKFYGDLYNVSTYESAIERMGLEARADVPVNMLSAGQQKRLALGRLLLRSSKIWVLDEAAVSLDVDGVELLKSLIQEHTNTGGVVVYTSHVDLELSPKILNLSPISQTVTYAHDEFMGAEWDAVS